jgi:hypothetical protein
MRRDAGRTDRAGWGVGVFLHGGSDAAFEGDCLVINLLQPNLILQSRHGIPPLRTTKVGTRSAQLYLTLQHRYL